MAVVGQHVEQQGGAQDIGAGVVANPVHGLAGPGLRRQMDHRIDIAQGQNPIPALADVAAHYLHVMFLQQSTQLGLGDPRPWICGLRLSNRRTVMPRRTNVRASASPMNPSPPVIRTFWPILDLNLFGINSALIYPVSCFTDLEESLIYPGSLLPPDIRPGCWRALRLQS